MARKKKVDEEKLEAKVIEHDKADVKEFEFATIVLTCKCGHTQEMIRHVTHGIQFILAANDHASLILHCDGCGSELRLHCIEGTAPPEPEKVVETETVETEVNEDIPEESKEGESL